MSIPVKAIVPVLLWSLSTLPATASQIWAGTGRISRGIGQGGLVELRIEIDGNAVKTLHGPRLNGVMQNRTIQNNLGRWEFRPCQQNLCVILNRTSPPQTILYQLHQIHSERAG